CQSSPSSRQRAQGMPDAGRTHGPPATKKAGGSHHRYAKHRGIPCATVYGLFRALPGEPGFVATIAFGINSQKLDTSVGVSGPHVFVRPREITRQLISSRPSHPTPNVCDDRETPLLVGAGWREVKPLICPTRQVHRPRHNNTTGNLRMADMSDCP